MKAQNNVNQRAGSRMALNLEAALFSSETAPLRARVHDISIGGAFLKTENVPPQISTQVTLGLCMDTDDGEQVYTLSGVVVHRSEQGAGVRFEGYDSETVRCLRHLYLTSVN